MGDPKKHRSKFSTPLKAWDKVRIDEEKKLIQEYYFKNKAEIWKLTSKLRGFARQAKKLIPLNTPQSEKEEIQLLTRLKSLGMVTESAHLDDVLSISHQNIFDRRLQSFVFKKGLARSMRQARQFIVHGHITVGNKKLTSPNFLVPKSQEDCIAFIQGSSLTDPMHPERIQEEKMAKKASAKTETKTETKKEEKTKKKSRAKKSEKPKGITTENKTVKKAEETKSKKVKSESKELKMAEKSKKEKNAPEVAK